MYTRMLIAGGSLVVATLSCLPTSPVICGSTFCGSMPVLKCLRISFLRIDVGSHFKLVANLSCYLRINILWILPVLLRWRISFLWIDVCSHFKLGANLSCYLRIYFLWIDACVCSFADFLLVDRCLQPLRVGCQRLPLFAEFLFVDR